jgi:hypothetical protein
MNELDMLRELAEETPLATPQELSRAHARLLDAIGAERRPNRRQRHAPAVWTNRRFGRAMAAIALAGAAAAAIVIVTQRPPVAERQVSPPAGHLTASQVLVKAAFVALHTNAEPPRPNQFIYTKVQASGGGLTQSWLSVDGARDSIIGSVTVPGCVDGGSSSCTPVRAYFPQMPTQPGKVLAYLERTQGVRPGNLNDLAKTAGTMLDSDYLLPAQQAALYQFLARTPGIRLVPHTVDAAGRPGVGVRWTLGGSAAMLIFDSRTLRYLGMATEGSHGQTSSNALVQIAIVDQAGELPGSAGSPSE